MMHDPCPAIRDVEHLEELLSEPSQGAIDTLAKLDGDIAFLGIGGKMGPTLARMAQRASQAAGVRRRILGVARFSQAGLEEKLRRYGIETLRCDLLDPDQVEHLPVVPNVVAMTGMKFGSTGQEPLTWAMNSHMPSLLCRKFKGSKIVAFSTGNVYGLSPVHLGGAVETDPLGPVGDYAQSTLGRERMYEYFCQTFKIPMALLRLNYATEMRYGVLVDIARKVHAGEPIDVGMGHLNAIWQGDANAMALCAFAHLDVPARILNIAGPETLSIRRLAQQFGQLFDQPAILQGKEADDALISNAQLSHRLFGYPRVSVQQIMHWIADWVRRGGASLGKPTHFEERAGKY